MSKYIDAEKINPMRCPRSIEEMRKWIDEQPTADVEEVVRCRACKHSDYIPKVERIYCMEHAAIMELNDYCSRGEISYE